MRRVLLICLVIGLLLVSCTAPVAQENGFSLPPVTPYPGWTVTYKLDLDILFQHPLELRKEKGNSAFEFAGPKGSYLGFSDTLSVPVVDDTVEKICQKEIADAAQVEKKFGSKPYGENPQLIPLQVDQQPACLILPSADQNESFQKRALLIVAYPKNLFLEPGTPRYLSMDADSDHIRSIAETIRFIPRTDQQVGAVLPKAATFAPTLSGSLTLKNQNVISITLDNLHIYWTVYEQPDTIFRSPLNGGPIEKIIVSKFKNGNVVVIPPIREGDWLIYLDNDGSAKNAKWALQAKNLQDGSEKVVLDGSGNQVYAFGLNISADNDWVAWSRTVPNVQAACEESILGLSNLRTNEQIELDRVCIDQYMWSIVSLSNQTLVAEQDFPDTKGNGSSLYLFDNFHNKQRKALTTDGRVSMPRVSYPWVVWKNALRFNWGYSNSIYDLGNKTQRAVILPGESPSDPKLDGQWLYWLIGSFGTDAGGIYLYDLKREQVWKLRVPKNGVLSATAIHDHWIAWSRRNDFQAVGDSVLEWGKLP